MANLITANLMQRPVRTLVSILAVAIGVLLILMVVGLSNGTLNDYAERTQNIHADVIFQPSGASMLFALNNATLPVKLQSLVSEVEGVSAVTPVMTKFSSADFGLIFGIDPGSFDQVSGGLKFVSGRYFRDSFEVVVDEKYASSKSVRIGDTLHLMGHEFRLAGIYRAGIAVRMFMPLKTLQKLNGSEDKASILFIRVGAAEEVEAVFQRLQQRFQGYNITRISDLPGLVSQNLPGLKEFTSSVIFVSVTISFLVILLAMYTTIVERTREIGILKSLGASKLYVMSIILKESLLISFLGILLGLSLSFLLVRVLVATFPTLSVEISMAWVLKSSLLGLLGSLLGALYPAFKAASQDPVQALSYE